MAVYNILYAAIIFLFTEFLNSGNLIQYVNVLFDKNINLISFIRFISSIFSLQNYNTKVPFICVVYVGQKSCPLTNTGLQLITTKL